MAGVDELFQMELNLHPPPTSAAYSPRTSTPAPSEPSSSASSPVYRASRACPSHQRAQPTYVTDEDEGVHLRLTRLLVG
jgi:hypothetical protein